MEGQGEERHNVLLTQVSDVRHRVANLEHRDVLSKEFMSRVGGLFDRVDQLEKAEMAERAVIEFKTKLKTTTIGGSLLGAVLLVLQILALMERS
jgi:hypothetical protein